MVRNKDFAVLYAGRAVFNKNGEFAGVVVGWNEIRGVIVDGWSSWGANGMSVSGDGFLSYEYRNAGTLVEPDELMDEEEVSKHMTIGELIKGHEGVQGVQFSTDGQGSVQAAYIRGKHGGLKLVSMGDGLENVSSKI
jgi:hypothetical protein|nr:MAG TPA: hypothetical protein [Caudoviricetes sp.]